SGEPEKRMRSRSRLQRWDVRANRSRASGSDSKKSRPMPVYSDSWPGKRKATGVIAKRSLGSQQGARVLERNAPLVLEPAREELRQKAQPVEANEPGEGGQL